MEQNRRDPSKNETPMPNPHTLKKKLKIVVPSTTSPLTYPRHCPAPWCRSPSPSTPGPHKLQLNIFKKNKDQQVDQFQTLEKKKISCNTFYGF